MRTLFTKSFMLLLIVFGLFGFTQSSAQDILDQYIGEGLKNNEVLKQKNIGLERAILSLKIANGMFLPSVNLQGSYTSGSGGRSISIPVGDLLNPVYATLNQLTESNSFPQIENVNQNFFPHNFYDAKVRTSVPIFNSDLIYNQKIKQQQIVMQEFEQDIYKRELVKNIKVAYFNYLRATEATRIYESALDRAQEGMRVNESLLANGKGLPAYVLRAQSEVENTKAQLVSSERQAHNAQLYFNFLLNRVPEASIVKDPNLTLDSTIVLLKDNPEAIQREEIRQVQEAISLNETVLKMNKLYSSPKLSGFVDLGSQYPNWKFNDQSRYYLFGVQLDVPLFAGFTNRHKLSQSALDIKSAELNYSVVTRQVNMGTQIAQNGLITALQNFQSAQKQLEAAQSYQRLIDKGYKEGVNTFIETVDARAQLTSAQLQLTISQYEVMIAQTNYERETASFPLSN